MYFTEQENTAITVFLSTSALRSFVLSCAYHLLARAFPQRKKSGVYSAEERLHTRRVMEHSTSAAILSLLDCALLQVTYTKGHATQHICNVPLSLKTVLCSGSHCPLKHCKSPLPHQTLRLLSSSKSYVSSPLANLTSPLL